MQSCVSLDAAYRPDIDGLRAICIISVVMFHAGFRDWAGGFVGVDIFFVISGYLITSLIGRQIAYGQFSLLGFYERRIRRLLAASIPVVLFTTLFALAFYSSRDLITYCKSLIAFIAYSSNWFFLSQAGYFATPAETSPLLHTWSLGVEEQFYLLFPALLLVLLRFPRAAAWVVAALAVASLACAQVEISRGLLDRAFFSSSSRFWELLAGALLALAPALSARATAIALPMRTAGLAMIGLSIVLYRPETPFPGVATLLPVGGALLLMAASPERRDPLWRLLSSGPFVYLGKISYSLYLWHWPVLGAVRTFVFDQNDTYMAVAIVVSVALASLSYHLVEHPIRVRRRLARPHHMAALLASTSLIGVAVGSAGWAVGGWPSASERDVDAMVQRALKQTELPPECFEHQQDRPAHRRFCTFGGPGRGKIDLLLWGDSHATSLFTAVRKYAEERGLSLAVAARAACLPLLGIRRANDTDEGCPAFNRSASAFIRDHDVAAVIWVARWALYTNDGPRALVDQQPDPGAGPREAAPRAILESAMRRTLDALQDRAVVIVEQVPEHKARVSTAYLVLNRLGGSPDSVRTDRTAHAKRQRTITEVMDRAAGRAGTLRIDPASQLCGPQTCIAEADGRILYFDANHLNVDGSLFIYPSMARKLDTFLAGRGIAPGGPR
jgi:peptidoglycan/LPS O-acetylase OafA/YrhL